MVFPFGVVIYVAECAKGTANPPDFLALAHAFGWKKLAERFQ
jgi:hypothetical protein